MLRIQNFSKTYKGGKKAVDDLSLHIQAGDLYAFIGHNGAGKTTTLKAAAGILEFKQGDILIDGISVKADPVACKQRMAHIPDTPALYDYLTGIQYINFIGDLYQIGRSEREANVKKYADAFEMTKNLGDLISSYSHGMRQKLAVIAAMMHRPRLLLLDEPFVGLDPKAALTLKTMMRELCDDGGAIFFSTHVLEVAEKLCDKVAIIKQGRLITHGETEAVRGDQSLEDIFMELVDNDA